MFSRVDSHLCSLSVFIVVGVPWASERVLPGLDDAARKQVQRSLDELALEGFVLTHQPKGAKTLGVRLADSGDARARALVGLPTLHDWASCPI